MKNLFTLLAMHLLWSQSFAQTSSKDGYCVMTKGDTIHVSFEPKHLRGGFAECVALDKSGAEIVYTPQQLRAYGTNDTHYESRNVSVPGGEITEFFKVLFRGDLSLYQGKKQALFIGADTLSKIYPLRNWNMFIYLTVNQPEMKEKIADTKLSMESAIRMLEELHNNENKPYAVYAPEDVSASGSFYLYGGMQYSLMKTTEYLPHEKMTSINPLFGAGYELLLGGRTNGGLSFVADFSYFKEDYLYENVTEYSTTLVRKDIYEFDASVATFTLGANGRIVRKPKTKLYLGGGVGYSLNFATSGHFERWEKQFDREFSMVRTEELQYYEGGLYTLFAAFGLEKKLANRIFFSEFRLEQNFGSPTDIRKARYQIRLGMRFRKF